MERLIGGPMLSGRPWPLGATWDGAGVNFALFSAHAERVELCLFVGDELQTAFLPERTDQVWHGYLAGASPGLRYAYRVYGPFSPEHGHRFDARCFLLDPYAREVADGLLPSTASDARLCAKACVTDDEFAWGSDAPPAVPLTDTVLYEAHVKGVSRQHPGVPEALRGTYAGLASPVMIEHFRKLGVSALNLLPVHFFLDEQRLLDAGRVNYWGYNSLAFFAPARGPGQLLGLQLARLLCSRRALRGKGRRPVSVQRVQDNGSLLACGGPRSHSRRCLQSHR